MQVLHRYFLQLERQAGWGEQVVSLARSLLHSLLVKVGNGTKRWMNAYDSQEWPQLIKVRSICLPLRRLRILGYSLLQLLFSSV